MRILRLHRKQIQFLLGRRFFIGACTLVFSFITAIYLCIPKVSLYQRNWAQSDHLILDQQGLPIQQLRTDFNFRQYGWIPLSDIAPIVQSRIIEVEDRRFYRHGGIDFKSWGGIFLDLVAGRKLRGASTITMQTTSFIWPKIVGGGHGSRSLVQKFAQLMLAPILEWKWSKQEILEVYLNSVSFRGERKGIGAASQGLFGRFPHSLGQDEALILAALIANPNASPEKVQQRICYFQKLLDPSGGGTCDWIRNQLSLAFSGRFDSGYAYDDAQIFARKFLTQKTGSSLKSTLIQSLQVDIQGILQDQLRTLGEQNATDGAILVADNKTGAVLAYVANGGHEFSSAPEVDGIVAKRQAGSILKPFIFGKALEQRRITAATLIEDAPLDLVEFRGVYRPENFDRKFHGIVSARHALAGSLNIPAIKVLLMAGPDHVIELLNQMSFSGLRESSFYGPSMAIGSIDVSLWELVGAYRALANQGQWSSLNVSAELQTASPKNILGPEASFVISDILSDRASRAATFGLENSMSTRFWTAVKTGTSKDMRDNWCVGFSEKYTVGVWVGNFSGLSMWDVSGVTGAAPAWLEVMNLLHKEKGSVAPKPPVGVEKIIVQDRGRHPFYEWFLKGTAPSTGLVNQTIATPISSKITYPADGTVFAMDPNLPPSQERIFFEADIAQDEAKRKNLHWMLNGKDIGDVKGLKLWKPTPGSYTLSLSRINEQPVQTIQFMVRDAGKRFAETDFDDGSSE